MPTHLLYILSLLRRCQHLYGLSPKLVDSVVESTSSLNVKIDAF